MRNYCTLFDSSYLPQGLALYESLARHSSVPFRLYVLPLDDEDCARILGALKLPHLIALDYRAFEHDQKLDEIRRQRTRQEFAWTCASQLCEWLLLCDDCALDEITYLDADVMVFGDLEAAFNEIGERSIAITPHRFIPSKKHLKCNGIFNVGFVYFRNTTAGRRCLTNWALDVRERCSAEVGCGDQKYLDSWPDEFRSECCVIQNIGVNAGPWSIGNWKVTEGSRLDDAPLFSFHFHEFRIRPDGTFRLTNYALRDEDRQFIYAPYVEAVERAKAKILSLR